jgi:hypothetical protein
MSWSNSKYPLNYEEMIERFGNETVTFSQFYKGKLTYTNENLKIVTSGEIYREKFVNEMKVREIPQVRHVYYNGEKKYEAVTV